jgi:signal transduction histidine kinase
VGHLAWVAITPWAPSNTQPSEADGRLAYEIVQALATPVVAIDADLHVHAANPAFEALFSPGKGMILGKPLPEIDAAHLSQVTIDALKAALSGRQVTVEVTGVLPGREDAPPLTVILDARPLRAGTPTPLALVSVTDVTARRHGEAQLARERLELERSNAALADFAHAASHDLQEPLRKIVAFAERILHRHAEGLSPEAKDYLGRIAAAALRMRALTDGLLEAARASVQAPVFTDVSLDVIAREVLVDLEDLIAEENAEVQVGPLPSIEADPFQMRQLLQNLLSNALKFRHPDRPPRVLVSVERSGPIIRLMVRDNGIGFAPQYQERIFGMFMRLHPRSEYAGSGIGLSLCRTIVLRHGGTITAVGEPGTGSTFIATLPVVQPPTPRGSQ